MKGFGRFSENLVANYVVKILEGLKYLHSKGVRLADFTSR